MAPEQIEGLRDRLGPATDVYGLGAILYELVTGRPPFRAETGLATLRLVVGTDPVRPSRLVPGCPHDLQTIVLKSLHKEPVKRYATAEGLADDLRRFLEGQPITARPTGLAERGVKWARRRPLVAALLAAVVLLFGMGFGGVTWQWWRADRERPAPGRPGRAPGLRNAGPRCGIQPGWHPARRLLPRQDREALPG